MAGRRAKPAETAQTAMVPVVEQVTGLDATGDHNVPLLVDVVWVRVAVAHDGLVAGSTHEMALTQRTQALVDVGYLEIVIPEGGLPGW
jgi:hypothetical protein